MATTVAETLFQRTAMEQVLETAELREAIFLQLPLRYLLLIQRVCRDWQATILKSITIQTALCFRPVKVKSTGTKVGSGNIVKAKVNEAGCSEGVIPEIAPCWTTSSAQEIFEFFNMSKTPVLNPLFDLFSDHVTHCYLDETAFVVALTEGFIDISQQAKGTSYERMYLTQPPVNKVQAPFARYMGFNLYEDACRSVLYARRALRLNAASWYRESIENESGVTVNDFLKHAARDMDKMRLHALAERTCNDAAVARARELVRGESGS